METSSFKSLALLSLLQMLLIGCGVNFTKNYYYNYKEPKDKNKVATAPGSRPVNTHPFCNHK